MYQSFKQEGVEFYYRGELRETSRYLEVFIKVSHLQLYMDIKKAQTFVRGRVEGKQLPKLYRLQSLALNLSTVFKGFQWGVSTSLDSSFHYDYSVTDYEKFFDSVTCKICFNYYKHLPFVYNKGDYIGLSCWQEDDEVSAYFPHMNEWADDYYIKSLRWVQLLSTPTFDEKLKAWTATVNLKDLNNVEPTFA